jgi:predicted dinucleotide-binding enzyme
MKIGVLGTGSVGRAIAGKLAANGHGVMMGTRDPTALLARTEPDAMGHPPFAAWHRENVHVQLGTFAEAAAHGELLVNATNGRGSLPALETAAAASAENLDGKVLVDISNPLDFSHGFPPSLFVANTDSLAEQIQRAYPALKVVKALNTVTARLMVNPALIPGDHDVFIAGNDADAKATVAALLRDEFGWPAVTDLGDLSAARALEMYLPLWLRLMGTLGTPLVNVKVVKG